MEESFGKFHLKVFLDASSSHLINLIFSIKSMQFGQDWDVDSEMWILVEIRGDIYCYIFCCIQQHVIKESVDSVLRRV